MPLSLRTFSEPLPKNNSRTIFSRTFITSASPPPYFRAIVYAFVAVSCPIVAPDLAVEPRGPALDYSPGVAAVPTDLTSILEVSFFARMLRF